MKVKNCLQLLVIAFSLLFITQSSSASFKEKFKDWLAKEISEEIIDVQRSIKFGRWIAYEISLNKKDILRTYIEVTNGVAVSVNLLDPSDYKKFRKGGRYRYYTSYHGKGVIKDKYTFKNTTTSETNFHLVISNDSWTKNSNLKIQVYRYIHKEDS